MRQSLWMIHSGLLGLCVASMSLLFLLEKPVLRKISIVPDEVALTKADSTLTVDVQAIYENDLFATYVASKKDVAPVEEQLAPLPSLPQDIPASIPAEKELVFLPPLEVTLKGVIYLQDSASSSLVIIQDKASKDEMNYQIGDSVEDGQILKIFADKVLLIRANGQQEMLYLKEAEAIADFAQEAKIPLEDVVVATRPDHYLINANMIGQYIPNIGSFIDMLDITTVFKQGKAIGCRIGKIAENSIGTLLGFEVEDIITQVNGISVANYKDRIQAYNSVITKEVGDMITVKITRNTQPVTLTYHIAGTKNMLAALQQEEISLQASPELSRNDVQQAIDTNVTPVQEHERIVTRNSKEDDVMRSIVDLDHGYFGDDVSQVLGKDTNSSIMSAQLERQQKDLFASRHKMAPTLQELEIQERRNMTLKGKNKIAHSVKK